jgi:8-oxo-dGTP diphosphatase
MPREYPETPVPAVGAVVLREDEVLLVRRGQEPSRGKWSIPGGVLELGETIGEAARREVREECGLEIEVGPVVEIRDAIFRDDAGRIQFHYVLIDIVARYVGGELTIGSDAQEARWVGKSELPRFDLTQGLEEVLTRVMSDADLDFPAHPG